MQNKNIPQENILEQIVERRKADISKYGFTYGCHIPERRTRKRIPFMADRGVILEIKRASPSKGRIAPTLNAAATACRYAAAGATAISVLTEQNWFMGSLDDLIRVAEAVPETAILRKDFLIDKTEIEIAWRCGADAVLLIARILSAEELVSMVKTCEELDITAFIEVRLESDINKLNLAVAEAPHNVIAGVNARDLRDFRIDPLLPIRLLPLLPERVVYESGIRTPQAATFTAELGFHGMLLGEAAARNPAHSAALVRAFTDTKENENGRFWKKLVTGKHHKRPLIKICGLTRLSDAIEAACLGADLLGFVFSPESCRNVTADFVRKTDAALKQTSNVTLQPLRIGVITDPHSAEATEAYRLVHEGILDAIQFHACFQDGYDGIEKKTDGQTPYFSSIPGYAAVMLETENDLRTLDKLLADGQPRVLVDARKTGKNGQRISDSIIRKAADRTKLWLAGGINPENIEKIIRNFCPELLDIASGIEQSPGIKDIQKMKLLFASVYKGGTNGS